MLYHLIFNKVLKGFTKNKEPGLEDVYVNKKTRKIKIKTKGKNYTKNSEKNL